jgi:hypothetical protein
MVMLMLGGRDSKRDGETGSMDFEAPSDVTPPSRAVRRSKSRPVLRLFSPRLLSPWMGATPRDERMQRLMVRLEQWHNRVLVNAAYFLLHGEHFWSIGRLRR